MNNYIKSMILLLAMMGCASLNKSGQITKVVKELNSIEIGNSKDLVLADLDKPSDIVVQKNEELWIYNNSDNLETQKGTVTFDLKNKIVIGVTNIIREGDSDENLNYLINNKFSSSKFIKIPLGKCHRHSYPREVYYIDSERGIVIEVDRISNSVNTISRTTVQYASELVRKIKSCEL